MSILLTITGILSISLSGALPHFTYRWSGRDPLISLIALANESVWGHMRLLFSPMFLFGLWSLKDETDACRISTFHAGLLMGTFLMPVLHYSYTSVLEHSILAMDITIFYICIITIFLTYRGLSGSYLLERYSRVTPMAVFLLLIYFLLLAHSSLGSSTFKDSEGWWSATK